MKNLFVKENNSGLIAAALFGSAALGALAYLFMTDSGAAVRGNLTKKAKKKAKDITAGAISKKIGVSKKAVKAAVNQVS